MATVQPGTHLGPYEILAPLGAGGMGEVYRARDTKLDRDVALKVLPAAVAEDAAALARFEREAKAVAALSHPNILAIFDFGTAEGVSFAVTELLDGETLRTRLAGGALPVRKAVEVGAQIAQGLAAAHDKGIVHRDLKPPNVFVCRDGRAKILDFGLARVMTVVPANDGGKTLSTPPELMTEPGLLLGTVGYMSPEQVRGEPADHRSDIFALGCVLYEMLSGQRPFHGPTPAETMTAILREDPPALPSESRQIPPALDRIVRRCLEKRPEERFQSARDLAFDLEALSGTSSGRFEALASTGHRRLRSPLRTSLVLLGVAVAATLAFVVGRRSARPPAAKAVSFSQLTFRQEPIFNARFAPDGKTILYSSAPAGNTPGISSLRLGLPGTSPLGLQDVHLLSVSSEGELAVLTHARYLAHSFFEGTLARMPIEGGAPREILDRVREADWSPDGRGLAVIRDVNGSDRLEYPIGNVLVESGGYLSNPRFSPRGDRIAYFEHPIRWDDRGLVAVVDLSGKRTLLSEGYWGEEGLAWSPDGREVLFSAGTAYNNFKVYAVDLRGRRRDVLESAGGVTIQDVGRDGHWLVTRDDFLRHMPVLAPGNTTERDLSWLDLSDPVALTPDGTMLLFSEESGSVGLNYAVCLRRTDGSPVVRLGEGTAEDLSADGKWALAVVPTSPQQLIVYPTGAGEPRRLDRGGIVGYESAQFFPDATRVLACGHEEGHAVRCYVQGVSGGAPRAVTPEGTSSGFVSPDGSTIIVRQSAGGLQLFSSNGGDPRSVPGANPEDIVVGWTDEPGSIFVGSESAVPLRVERLDLETGRRVPVRTLGPADLAGVLGIAPVIMTRNGRWYAYATHTTVSHLFVVDGAR
jgi:serine/threonine protein kinase/Tol biopolymer transport system component